MLGTFFYGEEADGFSILGAAFIFAGCIYSILSRAPEDNNK